MRALILGLVLLAGCGGSSDDPGLTGKWQYISPDGSKGLLLQFGDDGKYQSDNLFTSGNVLLDERDSGAYAATADVVTLSPTQSTCGNAPYTFGWRRGTDSLAISVASGEVILQPVAADGSTTGVALSFGCYDANGTWVPAQ
jgi:hypothetical protein